MKKYLGLGLALVVLGCVSAESNLARLQAECAVAPLAKIGGDLIPVPGAGIAISLTINAVCSNTALVANSEAAIASAIATIVAKKRN